MSCGTPAPGLEAPVGGAEPLVRLLAAVGQSSSETEIWSRGASAAAPVALEVPVFIVLREALSSKPAPPTPCGAMLNSKERSIDK